ncbi:MAG: hypothetical protein NVSMB32_00090 [Actinomycetota bacterium]
MSQASLETVESPFTTFRFEVLLDLAQPAPGLTSPLCNATFAECDGLEMTMEPKTVETGGRNGEQIHLVGPVKYGQLTLRRGMTANLQLWSWFALAGQPGHDSTAHGTVTMWDSGGTPVVTFALQECLPVKMRAPSLNAKEGLVAIEELGLVYRRLTVSAPGASGVSLGLGISASAGVNVGASASASVAVSGGGEFNASARLSGGFSGAASAGIGLG